MVLIFISGFVAGIIVTFLVVPIIQKAEQIYEQEFSGKLFRSQLAYHKDINYSEQVDYLPEYEEKEETIKAFLIEKALEW